MTKTPNSDHDSELPLNQTVSFIGELDSSASWWQQKSIRIKATILAITIGTIPSVTLGSIAYYFANQSIAQELFAAKQETATKVADKLAFYLRERYGDIQMMAALSILTNPKLRSQTTIQDKQLALDQLIQTSRIYNSVAAFDLQGNVIAQSQGKPLTNHKEQSYFQGALKTNAPVLSQPMSFQSSNISAVHLAAPIKDNVTEKTIGVLKASIPVKYLRDVILPSGTEKHYLLNNQGAIFAASDRQEHGTILSYSNKIQPASDRFDIYPNLQRSQQKNTKVTDNLLVSYVPYSDFQAEFRSLLPDLGWSTITTQDKEVVLEPQKQLRQVFILGTGIVAVGIGAISFVLAEGFLRPIIDAADAVEEIGRGNLDTRLPIKGADEIAQLRANINQMAIQLSTLSQVQKIQAQQAETIKNLARQLASATDKSKILDLAVVESYKTLQANRVVYYQLENNKVGQVVAELVTPGFISTLNKEIYNAPIITEYYSKYQPDNTQVQIINDLEQADLTSSHREILKSLEVKSSLIAPVSVDNKLDGLLIVHQCSSKRPWLDAEVEFITQIATQISFTIAYLELLNQQKLAEIRAKEAQETIQTQALSLLQELYKSAEGDLTVRAKVTEGEIGAIANSYNSTIASLQKLVNQTKVAATEVETNTLTNDVAVQELAQETVTQAEQISRIVKQVNAMEQSIELVSTQATQAEDFVKQASFQIDSGDKAINQTVAEINAVQTTVTETATKAQKLGASSQEISQAVNLIGRFAAQTHLLALKASIEAARAGEQGKGFAVIADEVRSLATQSAEATSEIETLVNKIQLETNEVVKAMNKGTEQIAVGNELVQQTRQSLSQVSQVSHEINNLVGSITLATKLQSKTSTKVSQTMGNVAAIAENNSQFATEVSASIKNLSTIAAKLKSNIGKFKT